ncbi:hypothetical protein H6P81_016957 [Aristolochia fimbriata]|uniref:Uncharacterized protein n=1 Tax=Aristolochia fimbriata TaxID=158543 RepID=A0AAV7DXW5_ARIFI|nr:hypothetical protein H6P81_016957 [Aristolochia fimbriata]
MPGVRERSEWESGRSGRVVGVGVGEWSEWEWSEWESGRSGRVVGVGERSEWESGRSRREVGVGEVGVGERSEWERGRSGREVGVGERSEWERGRSGSYHLRLVPPTVVAIIGEMQMATVAVEIGDPGASLIEEKKEITEETGQPLPSLLDEDDEEKAVEEEGHRCCLQEVLNFDEQVLNEMKSGIVTLC